MTVRNAAEITDGWEIHGAAAGSVAYRAVKRTFDFICSLCASIVLLVPMGIIAVLIMIKDPGNPFYLQKRVGQNGKTIRMLKFRTMRRGADQLEKMLTPEQIEEYKREFKIKDDPRLLGYQKTGDGDRCFGAMLRKASIDELPQILYNVCVKGDMSLVGPRPILQEELEEYYSPEERELLLSVKPGITGLWQTQGRNDCTYESGERQKVELYYVRNRGLLLDLKILIKTIGVVVRRGGGILTKSVLLENTQEAGCTPRIKGKPAYDFVKRVFDFIVAVICLTFGLPVYLLIALAIVIDDPGNPLFIQKRVGKNGQEFRMVKFRTMYRDADKKKAELLIHNERNGVHFKMENDPRVTRVGNFLRRTSLDETAQAVNLLAGTMTVIGPRPFIPEEQCLLPPDRLAVKPGLSCYWQIADTTGMSDEEQLELDYRYIRERGIRTDLKLIGLTVKTVILGKNC